LRPVAAGAVGVLAELHLRARQRVRLLGALGGVLVALTSSLPARPTPNVSAPVRGVEVPTLCAVAPVHDGPRVPLMVVVGGSFTAGVGAGPPNSSDPSKSWAVRLAEMLGWRALVIGAPAAAFFRPGGGHVGPLGKEADMAELAVLKPRLVVVQGGEGDKAQTLAHEAKRVASVFATIHSQTPRSSVGLLSVFVDPGKPTSAEVNLDRTVLSSAKAGDPAVVTINPIHWSFPRTAPGQMHPNATGYWDIAVKVGRDLAAAKAVPERPFQRKFGATRVSCQYRNLDVARALGQLDLAKPRSR
jgi:hypothetical protein